MTFLSMLIHTISLHLLLSRAVFLLFDEDLLTLGDCMILRYTMILGYRAFCLQISVFNFSPAYAGLILHHAMSSAGTIPDSSRHRGTLRALSRDRSAQPREQLAPADGKSIVLHRDPGETVLLIALFLLH